MARWHIVKHPDGFSVQDRPQGVGELLANFSGKKNELRAKYLCDAANLYDPNWRFSAPDKPLNLMDSPIEWKKRKRKRGVFLVSSALAQMKLCDFKGPGAEKMAQRVVDICNQSEMRTLEAITIRSERKSEASGEGIKKALSSGCKIHAFRSGGGLRVVRVEKNDKLLGYGEHPDILEAVKHADEDYLAGGRDYHKVYGKIYAHYMTGTTEASCDLDRIILKGSSFDCEQVGGKVFFTINGWVHLDFPKDVMEAAKKAAEAANQSPGPEVYYKTDRGYYLAVTYQRQMFANGGEGWSSRCIHGPEGENDYKATFYESKFVGSGEDMMSAFEDAHKLYQIKPSHEIVSAEDLKKAGIETKEKEVAVK